MILSRHSEARAQLASPESITTSVRGYGFRARRFAPSRNDVVAWFIAQSLLAFSFVLMPAWGADYPTRIVTIVALSAFGGLYSLFARIIGNRLEQRLGQTFVVENRPGAASVVGAVVVARAAPDGYTLMIASGATMAVNVTLHKTLPYDPTADLVPVALIARIPEVLVVNAALPVHSLADLAALAKSPAGRLSYGSPGAGTGPHLSGVALAEALGVELTHVPYKGMSPAINDVAGGHVPL